MALDEPGRRTLRAPLGTYLWPALALARALQRAGSVAPLLVFTNTSALPDGTDVATAFCRFGAHTLPVQEVPVKGLLSEWRRHFPQWETSWLKLQAWRLTQFRRLVWLDSDALVTRSLDWLFHEQGTWAQANDWDCTFQTPFLCGGLFTLKPSEEVYQAMLRFENELPEKQRSSGNWNEQVLIQFFVGTILGEPVRLLDSRTTALFGHCLDAEGYGPPSGRPPAFVHKTLRSRWSDCFSLQGQLGDPLCAGHPLGRRWRRLLCEAATTAGSSDADVDELCGHRQRPPVSGRHRRHLHREWRASSCDGADPEVESGYFVDENSTCLEAGGMEAVSVCEHL